jgi:hypothetical protein
LIMAAGMPSTGNRHFRNYLLTGHIADMAQTLENQTPTLVRVVTSRLRAVRGRFERVLRAPVLEAIEPLADYTRAVSATGAAKVVP